MNLNPIRILRRLIEKDGAKEDIARARAIAGKNPEIKLEELLGEFPSPFTLDHIELMVRWLTEEPEQERVIMGLAFSKINANELNTGRGFCKMIQWGFSQPSQAVISLLTGFAGLASVAKKKPTHECVSA